MALYLKNFDSESLFNVLPINIIIKDLDHRIVKISDYAAKQVGKSAKELIGKSLVEVFGVSTVVTYNDEEKIIKTKRPIYNIKESITFGNGKKLHVKVDKIPILDDCGEVAQIVVMAQDITDLVETQKETIKLQSLADIGVHTTEIVHNLKNPLTASIGYVNLMKKLEGGNELLDRVESSNKKILEIITDILQGTKEASSLNYVTEPFEITIAKVIDDIIRNKDSDIMTYLQTDIEVDAHPDIKPIHLAQVMSNIINNAIEELGAEKQNKKIEVRATQIGSKIAISISDNGDGIEEDNLPLIFNAQYSTKGEHGSDKFGTGLGLSYCKRMLEFYKGSIGVESQKGHGTQFTMYLPMKK